MEHAVESRLAPIRSSRSPLCLVGKELLLPASGAIKASLIVPFGRSEARAERAARLSRAEG